MTQWRKVLIAFVLIGLCSTNERRPARADEPTPAGSVFDRLDTRTETSSERLKRFRDEAARTAAAAESVLAGEPPKQPVLEDVHVEPVIKSVVKRPAAKPRPTARPSADLFSAEATIIGPDQIETGEGGEYRLSVPAAKLVWKVYPSRMILRQDNGRLIFFAGKVERTYTLLAVFLDTSGELSEAEKIVTVGAPAPVPVPPPGPGPAPPPTPGPPVPPPGPAPVYPVPSAEFQAIVAPVKAVMATADATDKRDLAKFFQQFADVVLSDSAGVIKTTAQLRTANSQAGNLAFGTRFKGRYVGLKEALEASTASALGLESRNLDAALRQRAVSVFQALSWAVGT